MLQFELGPGARDAGGRSQRPDIVVCIATADLTALTLMDPLTRPQTVPAPLTQRWTR